MGVHGLEVSAPGGRTSFELTKEPNWGDEGGESGKIGLSNEEESDEEVPASNS